MAYDAEELSDLLEGMGPAGEEMIEAFMKQKRAAEANLKAAKNETAERIDAADSFSSLSGAIHGSTDEQILYTKVVETSMAVWGNMTSAVSTVTSVLADMTKSALSGEGFDMFRSMIDPIADLMESLGKVVGSVVSGMLNLGADIPGIGGLFETLGTAAKGAGEAFGKATAAVFKFVANLTLDATQQLWDMFEGTASAGLLVANGLHEMLISAKSLNLTTQEYTKLIQNQTANLSEFGGSVAKGAKQLALVAEASADHNQELRGLGISYQEQAEMTSEFMSSLQRTGQLTLMTTTQIADASFEYMKNLRIISALTGKSAENMKKDRDAALSNLAFQAKLAKMDPDIRKEMESALAGMPEGMQQAFKESVIFGKVMTDTGAIVSGASVYIEKFANSIANGESIFQDAFTNFRKDLKDNGPELRKNILGLAAAGMAELLGRGNVVTSSINEFSSSLLRQLAIAEGSLIDDVEKTAGAGKTAGESITNIVAMMDTQRQLMHAILEEAEKRMGPLSAILVGLTENVKSVFETVAEQVDSGAISEGIEAVKEMAYDVVETIDDAMTKVSSAMEAISQLIKDITESEAFKFMFGEGKTAAEVDATMTESISANIGTISDTKNQMRLDKWKPKDDVEQALKTQQEIQALRNKLELIEIQKDTGEYIAPAKSIHRDNRDEVIVLMEKMVDLQAKSLNEAARLRDDSRIKP